MKYRNLRELADYFGVVYQTMKYHSRLGHIVPDSRLGSENLYSSGTAMKFAKTHLGKMGGAMSVSDIMKKYGKTKYAVDTAIALDRFIVPVSKRQNTKLYSEATVKAMAYDNGWIENGGDEDEDVQSEQIQHVYREEN